jgi:hypothetical protein
MAVQQQQQVAELHHTRMYGMTLPLHNPQQPVQG